LIQTKKAHQIYERRSKEERAKLLEESTQIRGKLGAEKSRNDTIEKVILIHDYSLMLSDD
jgi:hypothetical protein